MAKRARWAAAAAVSAVAAGASLWTLTPAAAIGPVNPVDGGLGFLVLVEEDATLRGNESEGPVAIGGDLTLGGTYRVASDRGVQVGGEAEPTALAIGGRALFLTPPHAAGSQLSVTKGKWVKLGDDAGVSVRENGTLTQVIPDTDGTFDGTPLIQVSGDQAPSQLIGRKVLDFGTLFTIYRDRSTQLATCPNTVALLDSAGADLARPLAAPHTQAHISLAPDRTNVLNLTGAEFNNLSDLTFNTQPSAETPLVINVATGATYTWSTPNFAGVGNAQAPYILMNFPDATEIVQKGSSTAEGTIYAPRALFTDVNAANNEGSLVVRGYVHGTAEGQGGETHDLPFGTTVECASSASDAAFAAPSPAASSPTTTPSGTAAPVAGSTPPRPTPPSPVPPSPIPSPTPTPSAGEIPGDDPGVATEGGLGPDADLSTIPEVPWDASGADTSGGADPWALHSATASADPAADAAPGRWTAMNGAAADPSGSPTAAPDLSQAAEFRGAFGVSGTREARTTIGTLAALVLGGTLLLIMRRGRALRHQPRHSRARHSR